MVLQVGKTVIGEVLHGPAFEPDQRQHACPPGDPGNGGHARNENDRAVDLLQACAGRRVQGIDSELVEEPLIDQRRDDIAADCCQNAEAAEQQQRRVREGVAGEDF